jgi:hypothetical protein
MKPRTSMMCQPSTSCVAMVAAELAIVATDRESQSWTRCFHPCFSLCPRAKLAS